MAQKHTPVNPIQLLFVIISLTAFVLQIAWIVYMMWGQYPDNTNFSAYASLITGSIMVPIALFAISYVLSPTKSTRFKKVFESTLMATIGVSCMVLGQQAHNLVVIVGNLSENSFWAWYRIDLSIDLLIIVALTGCLIWLKRTKRWA